MEVKPVKKETLTEQIMNQLAEQITSGELKAGERLPDERSLAEMFGVTRSRIREALRALSLIGLIDIRPGGGSFVSEQSTQIPKETILWSYHREISDYENLYDARKLIEGTVYLSCFDRRTDEVVDTLQDYADQLFALDTNKVSAEHFSSLIDEIDTYVGAHCGNGIYDKLMQTMIVLRHDSALQILSTPASKESAVLWRVKVLKSFAQDDRSRVVSNVDGFFANSISQLTNE
uniref:FadR/GntR family transcriptional regulator n=1 Tax=Parolsenella massiliensis TaxID=1871022 RepID=UPI0009320DE9|nr:GntR family transcriptional regulator [Parolsenella massiliensis]